MVRTGTLFETASLDGKGMMDDNTRETAKDIAAMANEGGVILYGISSDEKKRLTIESPVEFFGFEDKISQVVHSCIAEQPYFWTQLYPLQDDPTRGFVAVIVPPSPRAPHMVTKGGDNRYYRRNNTISVPMNESEVALLYARRARLEADAIAPLRRDMENPPLQADTRFAYLHLIAVPALPMTNMVPRIEGGAREVHEFLSPFIKRSKEIQFVQSWSPDFAYPIRLINVPSGYIAFLCGDEPRPEYRLDLQIDFSGTVHLFCGRGAEEDKSLTSSEKIVFDSIPAGLTIRFAHFVGELYAHVGYRGAVNLGVGLTNAKSSVLSSVYRSGYYTHSPKFPDNEYVKTTSVFARELTTANVEVAQQLLEDFYAALSQRRPVRFQTMVGHDA